MVIDKNYFLARLANGEDISHIGEDIADMMNAAVAEHEAIKEAEAAEKAAAAEKAQTKRDLIENMINIIKDLAELEGMDPNDFAADEKDIDELVEGFTDMFQALMLVKKIVDTQEHKRFVKTSHINAPKSDDEVLANFINSLI